MCPPLLSSMWKITQLQKNGHKFKFFFLTGCTYRCITKHLKIKSFPTPQRYALKATFVDDSNTVSIAIIYLGDNRFLQHKNTKRQYSSAILQKYLYLFLKSKQAKVWSSGRAPGLYARERWIEPSLCCLVFSIAFPLGKTISNVWVFHPLKRNQNRKFTKSWKFPSFERKYNRKITKSRKFPSFEQRIYSENFETVENLHRKCWKKPNMSIAKVEIILHHPDCLVCATRWS